MLHSVFYRFFEKSLAKNFLACYGLIFVNYVDVSNDKILRTVGKKLPRMLWIA